MSKDMRRDVTDLRTIMGGKNPPRIDRPGPRPAIIITGQKRAGLSMLYAMLTAGGIESNALALAPEPHRSTWTPVYPCLGLFAERSTGSIIKSIAHQNALEGRAPLAPYERRILHRSIARDFRRARDAAASAFSPLVMFQFESIIVDPAFESARLHRLLIAHWPHFDPQSAALAVRRIHLPPKVVYLRPVAISPPPGGEVEPRSGEGGGNVDAGLGIPDGAA